MKWLSVLFNKGFAVGNAQFPGSLQYQIQSLPHIEYCVRLAKSETKQL
jgi:hypothetical protein